MKFKDFMKYYSYGYVRIFVDQIAIAVFAVAVAVGVSSKGTTLAVISSIFSVCFFLFAVAALTFKQGISDKEKTELGRFKKNSLTGFYMGLIASIPNFVLALLHAFLALFPSLQNYKGIVNVIMKLIYGEYLGLLTLSVGEKKLGEMILPFFIMIIPTLLAAFFGYYFAINGIIVPKPTKKDLE